MLVSASINFSAALQVQTGFLHRFPKSGHLCCKPIGCNQGSALVQVAAYARKYRYLQQDYDEAASRLHTVERLLKQYQCSTSEELLTEVDQAQADLDRWYALEGNYPIHT